MISNKRHQELLAQERAFWQRTVTDLLDRIGTFHPTANEAPETPQISLALAPPRTAVSPWQEPRGNVPIAPGDEKPYISDFEMDDDAWEAYVEAARVTSPTIDETQNIPAPVTDR